MAVDNVDIQMCLLLPLHFKSQSVGQHQTLSLMRVDQSNLMLFTHKSVYAVKLSEIKSSRSHFAFSIPNAVESEVNHISPQSEKQSHFPF